MNHSDPLLNPEIFFCPTYHELETRALAFEAQYLTHALLMPKQGERMPSVLDKRWIISHAESKPLLDQETPFIMMNNQCPHRGATVCSHHGEGAMVCPLHQWSYDESGQAIGHQSLKTPLASQKPISFLGLLFDKHPLGPQGHEIEKSIPAHILKDFSFEGYKFHQASESVWPINWKSFMEMHLDLMHVAGAHPGLSSLVSSQYDASGLEKGEGWIWQGMKSAPDLLNSPSTSYQEYGRAIERLNGQPNCEGASWLTLYPGIMIEKNPESLMVSVIEPRGPRSVLNRVDFFYKEEALAFEPELANWHQKAYAETADEDLILCQNLEQGREVLWKKGLLDQGPLDPLLEAGLPHFHQWLRSKLNAVKK